MLKYTCACAFRGVFFCVLFPFRGNRVFPKWRRVTARAVTDVFFFSRNFPMIFGEFSSIVLLSLVLVSLAARVKSDVGVLFLFFSF